jgi:beta-xylosidase
VNPLVYNGLDPVIQRTGHADLVQTAEGQWWMVMLGVRHQETQLAQLGRETFLAPVEWPEGGWPKVNNGKLVGTGIEGSLPEKKVASAWKDDFTSGRFNFHKPCSPSGSLELGWYHLRTPIKPCHSFNGRENHLTLISNGFKMDQFESPAMILRKQTAYRGIWSTRLDFEPTNDFEEAGTVVFYSDVSYAAIIIKSVQGSKVIVARWTDPETRTVKVGRHTEFKR